MSFENLKGQDSAVSYLKASLRNGRVSHAYIFSGPVGVGKHLAAVNFAKALNCSSSVSGSGSHPELVDGSAKLTIDPEQSRRVEGCDRCSSCKKIDSLSHPDIFTLKPKEEGGSIKTLRPFGRLKAVLSNVEGRQAQGLYPERGRGIKIEDVRALIKDVYLKPFEARKKVYMIEGAEHMKHEAANALLKTLEEPPADSVIILLTENIKALFHTIVSRCQVVKFFPLKLQEVEDILIKEHSLSKSDAHTLSHLSGGRLGEALKFKEEDIFTKRSLLINKILSPFKADFDFDDLPKEDVRIYLDMMLAWYSDILNMKAGAGDHMLINIDKKDIISKESGRLGFDHIEDMIKSVISAMTQIEQNANQKLAMSVLGMKIKQVSVCTK
ncbi:MAG: DNA polymerase III subunit delta' [Candidatus Omnitrophota bacterium]|nr:DNA polymerase III subunit delta' [Candidatus Omnitrophota bacterium]